MTALRHISLVLPVKQVSHAKSRMAVPRNERRRLALGLIRHTLDIATTCLPADQVYVVTSDPQVREFAGLYGARFVADPGRGLNPAAEQGVAEARARADRHAVVVLVSDLPGLTSEALRVLFDMVDSARDQPICVADYSGRGTTAVSCPPGVQVPMVFGRDSAIRFTALGCRRAHRAPAGLVTDLDTVADWHQLRAQSSWLWPPPEPLAERHRVGTH